jgi:hypothetical protein
VLVLSRHLRAGVLAWSLLGAWFVAAAFTLLLVLPEGVTSDDTAAFLLVG